MEFKATDFPEPVVPATNICGSPARSSTTGTPSMFLPKAKDTELFASSNNFEAIISLSKTFSLSELGTSIPMVSRPSITSTILMLPTPRDLAKSLFKLETCETLIPLGNSTSNLVTTGPRIVSLTTAYSPSGPVILNSANLVINASFKISSSYFSFDDISFPIVSFSSSNPILGISPGAGSLNNSCCFSL